MGARRASLRRALTRPARGPATRRVHGGRQAVHLLGPGDSARQRWRGLRADWDADRTLIAAERTPSVGNKLCPKVILEGTRLTFKTDIAFALNEHPRIVGPRKYRYHSPLISAEWCAFTNFPWGRGLINFAPEEEALAMETYHTWVRLFELQRYYSWIVDRFHLSTRMTQLREHGKDHDFTWLEQRLIPLGFRLVYVTRSAESFEAARAERLKVSGNPRQYDDLGVFVEEQALLDRLVGESRLPVLHLDISDNDVPRAVEQIADWLEQTGGLYAP